VTLPTDADASGRSLGAEELDRVAAVIQSGVLTSTKGSQVAELERNFAEALGVRYAIACSSGTAALHTALAAIDPEPGDEVVTTPITDIGAIAPILYQTGIPVFADVDPRSANVTARTISERLSSRTRAIVATHLFGNPCDIQEIVAVAGEHGIPVIEDCAQAYLASSSGRLVGTFGTVGCFSLQQSKHITSGEGGIVVTDDPSLARRMRLFVNKAWPYGEAAPDHEFLALNYRMSELQGAVAVAQLDKLDGVVSARIAAAERFSKLLSGIPGLQTPHVRPTNVHSYWRYCVRVDSSVVRGGPVAVASSLRSLGVPSAPRYIDKPAFRCAVIAEQRTFGRSRFPFNLARPEAVDYAAHRFPGTFAALETALVLPWNERLTDADVEALAGAIAEAVERVNS
jgi:dTDP-4-amino-4,6-dideoxygalactose transaminase